MLRKHVQEVVDPDDQVRDRQEYLKLLSRRRLTDAGSSDERDHLTLHQDSVTYGFVILNGRPKA